MKSHGFLAIGGSCNYPPRYATGTYSDWVLPVNRFKSLGLRLVRTR